MKASKPFLCEIELEEIKKAIVQAELTTSGEIVVTIFKPLNRFLKIRAILLGWLIPSFSLKSLAHQKAVNEFMRLGIQQTQGRTGVLICIAPEEKMINIIADRDINNLVESKIWDAAVVQIQSSINLHLAGVGICHSIKFIGQVLAEHFPRKADDKNELPDEVHLEK